jgi:hypothetical protein
MSRAKSSNLARLNDLIDSLAKTCHDLHEEFDKLKTDSERLKEIEPALKKLQSALNPPKAGDLCDSCKNRNTIGFDCTHDAAESCANYEKLFEKLPATNNQGSGNHPTRRKPRLTKKEKTDAALRDQDKKAEA